MGAAFVKFCIPPTAETASAVDDCVASTTDPLLGKVAPLTTLLSDIKDGDNTKPWNDTVAVLQKVLLRAAQSVVVPVPCAAFDSDARDGIESKAWTFAEQMSAITANIRSRPADAIFFDALRMLTTQQEFRAAGKPTVVDLGYHYTKSKRLTSIYTNDLLNQLDRDKLSLSVHNNGAKYGHGIYTATSPCSFHHFGDAGLLVLRLAGDNIEYDKMNTDWGKHHDSMTAKPNTPYEMMVLKTSQQCFPVLQFDAKKISPSNHACPGNMLVMSYHVAIKALVDDIFNSKDDILV
jgi:hypothetical protein